MKNARELREEIFNEKMKFIKKVYSPTDKQIGGDHYKDYAIQPVEFCIKNDIPFAEGSVIKYVIRHREKGGVVDIDKAIHYLELIKEMRYGKGSVG